MLLEDAAIHDDQKAGLAGALRGRFVDDAFLEPDGPGAGPDGLIDDLPGG